MHEIYIKINIFILFFFFFNVFILLVRTLRLSMWNVGLMTFRWWAHFWPRRLTRPSPSSCRTRGWASYRSKYSDRDTKISRMRSGSATVRRATGPNQRTNVEPATTCITCIYIYIYHQLLIINYLIINNLGHHHPSLSIFLFSSHLADA